MAEERVARRYTRLTEDRWSEAEELWSTGDVTLEELAEIFDVSVRNLQNRFSARGILKGAPAGGFAVPDIELEPLGDISDVAAQAVHVRSRTVGAAREIQAQLMASVRALRSDATTRPAAAVRTLVAAASALERLHAIERTALGLDNGDLVERELPVLTLVNLTATQIEEIQRGPDDDDDGDLMDPAAA